VQPPLKRHKIGDKEFKGFYLWFDDIGLVEVEVVDEGPPTNFNPPLTERDTPILVEAREIFSDPLSFFSHPPTMSGPNVSSSVAEPTIPSSSGTGGNPLGGISVMSTLPPLISIRPTLFIPFYIGPLIPGTPTVSSFPSINFPSISTPIPSVGYVLYYFFLGFRVHFWAVLNFHVHFWAVFRHMVFCRWFSISG
jgi:hypothetical protein